MSGRDYSALPPERLQFSEDGIAAAYADLERLGYHLSPADARHYATAFCESEDRWCERWAEALQEYAAIERRPWKHLTAHVREAIRQHFRED